MVKKDPYCRKRDCRYHSIRVCSACVGSCSYLDITGKTKLGQLTPVQRRLLIKGKIPCPFYEPGKQRQRPRIVDALFPQKKTRETKEAGLPKRIRMDRAKMRTLYDQGLNDYEIARVMQCSGSNVWAWRRREGLPPNCEPGQHHGNGRGNNEQ